MTQGAAQATNNADTFSGEEDFAAPPQRMFEAITNLDVDGPLAQSIPDLVSAEREGERTLQCKVKPGFSFMRATMKLTVELTEVDEAQRSASMRLTSKGIGASMKVQCRMKVSDAVAGADRSRIKWEARVEQRTGLLAAVSPALIRGAADKVVRDGWDALRRQIEQ